MTDEPPSKSNAKESLEEAFCLIKSGKEQESAGELWKAAGSYSLAYALLNQLANEQDMTNEEQHQIATLYLTQSSEYLQRARQAILSVLNEETNDDRGKASTGATNEHASLPHTSPLLQRLTEEESFARMKIFGRLFATEPEDLKTVKEQESVLEERLRKLNDSIPSGLKSEEERVRDLNKGLRRLGIAVVPDGSEPRHQSLGLQLDALPKSECEQVDDIIAQAKDEAAVTKNGLMSDGELAEQAAAGNINIAENVADALLKDDSSDDDFRDEDSYSDDDANLTPTICKNMHDKLVDVQVSISELLALFEADDTGNAEIEFDQARGKNLLKDARHILRNAADLWNSA